MAGAQPGDLDGTVDVWVYTLTACCERCGLVVSMTLQPMSASVAAPATVRTACPVCNGPLAVIGPPG